MQTLRKSIRIRSAIALDENNLTSLLSIIYDYYPDNNARMIAVLQDNREVEFDSVDKLLQHDNYRKTRIVAVCLACDKLYKIVFTCKFPIKNFICLSTVEADFSMDEEKYYTLINNDFEKFFEKAKQPIFYTIMVNALVPVLLAIYTIGFLSLILYHDFSFDVLSAAFIVTIVIGAISFATAVLVKPLWLRVFCPVQFLWGEEIKRVKKVTSFTWYILGIVTGVLVNFISKLLFG